MLTRANISSFSFDTVPTWFFVCLFSHVGPSIIQEVIQTDQAHRGPQSKNNKREHYHKFGKLKMNFS